MDKIIFTGYEALAMFIPFLAAFFIRKRICPERGGIFSITRGAYVILFAVYISAVFHFTGAGTLYDLLLYRLEIRREQVSLIPFCNEIDMTAYLQNILLFIPFGFLLPFIWRQSASFIPVAGAGFSLSLLVEVSQLLNNRRTDIDDLILNTLGAVLGFAVYKLLNKKIRRSDSTDSCEQISCCKWEPLIYIAVIFVGRFLLFNEMGLARMIYGF